MVVTPRKLRDAVARHATLRKVLLGCGVVAPAWWATMDVVASLRYPGYSYVDQTISELSAQGAPTRPFLIATSGFPHDLLAAAFGLGAWASGNPGSAARRTGTLLMVGAAVDLPGGILFPMQTRGNEATLRNALHIPFGALDVLLFLLTMASASGLLGKHFRSYTYATVATLLASGTLTALQSGGLARGERTPRMGVEERVGVYATMAWLTVLAIGLLRGGPG
ncbi:MAG TPA: DUF998 domain-containing protein [Thermomicrobiaceae bacterium]|nr:DUF998 domain-containing protein [Thermomicrobiaceae bacterium]